MRVRGCGPSTAAIIVLGEAPGQYEVERGQPFVGASGQLLERWWSAVGLHRSELRLENVCEVRPAANKIEALSPVELDGWIEDCRQRLQQFTHAKVIVPLGNTALRATTGRKGISKWRGSLLSTQIQERAVVVLPSLHPAAILRQPYWEKRCRRDWEKVVIIHGNNVDMVPQRRYGTKPTLAQCDEFLGSVRDSDTLSIDIETPGGIIACVGFAVDRACSFTIPTTVAYWGGDTPKAWAIVRALCEHPCAKVMQNGHFDTYWLRQIADITVNNWQWDTLAMHHCLDSADDHSLAYMASMDTWEPFWKEWDDKDNLSKYTSNVEALWQYNGVDACVTRELFDVYYEKLVQSNKLEFYQRHYAALFQPLLDLSLHGIRVDEIKRRKLLTRLLCDTIECEQQLQHIAGTRLHSKTAISSKKVINYVKSLKLKVPRKRQTTGEFGDTMDEVAVRKLMQRSATFRPIGALVLRHRGAKKQAEFLDPKRIDKDGRFRSSYKFTTDTGRFASSKNPRGTGANAQNIDRALRSLFVPNAGCILLKIDLSQAESRIVFTLTGDPELVRLAQTPPTKFDIHLDNAALIFGIDKSAVTKEQRFIGKRAIHASHYGMRGKKLNEVLLNEGYTISIVECDRLIRRYLDRYPAIERWQQETRAAMLRQQRLVNSWGRERLFLFDRMDDETYRQGYAFVPQSEVIDLLNQRGFIPLMERLQHRQLADYRTRVNLHVHDELVASTPPEHCWDVAKFLCESLMVPREINGNPLSMFVEVAIGMSWRTTVEWKALPSRDEMTVAALSLVR